MTYPLLEWREIVLAKFPAFDPQWPDDAKLRWFDAFLRLLNNDPLPRLQRLVLPGDGMLPLSNMDGRTVWPSCLMKT